ncbi:MAG TPA: hypothetical protein VEY92_01595 [Pseudoxanthomonas sp.]|nr:hypothetical protein [Pseudoxanthomonas sp.]
MAKKPLTRAQNSDVSTKKLRRMASLRIERMRNAMLAIEQAWAELDDSLLGGTVMQFNAAIDKFEKELAEIAEYHDKPAEGIN